MVDATESTLQDELQQTIDRLKELGGAVVLEEFPGSLEDDAGEARGDAMRASEEREITFAIRDRLVERANRLAEALDRLRSGEYGTCQVCGDPIAPARLRVLPEVTTCVACQEAEEHGERVTAERGATRAARP